MNPTKGSRVVLGLIMATALLSYLTIAANVSNTKGAGIYELEVVDLACVDWPGTNPIAGKAPMHLDSREGC